MKKIMTFIMIGELSLMLFILFSPDEATRFYGFVFSGIIIVISAIALLIESIPRQEREDF